MIHVPRKQTGLSLVELMVAITLSLVLTLGIIQIFSSSKQTSRVQEALARLQENARFALDILAHDIRMAGQLGCNGNAHVSNNSGLLRDFGRGISGYEYSGLPLVLLNGNSANPSSTQVVSNTDAIVIMSAAVKTIPVTSTTTLATATGHGFATGTPLIISDCENADLFIADTVTANSIAIANASSLSKAYSAGAELAALNYTAYYVRVFEGQKNLYRSLVREESNAAAIHSEPLLEGVEDMQILYGEDINGNGSSIRYVPAGTTGLDMSRVSSVRINLLLSTLENNLASEPQSYWFNGAYLTAPTGDRRLYRSFTTTIQLRNHGIGI